MQPIEQEVVVQFQIHRRNAVQLELLNLLMVAACLSNPLCRTSLHFLLDSCVVSIYFKLRFPTVIPALSIQVDCWVCLLFMRCGYSSAQ